jgi:16S rRNA (uracil1498-N3)-methyltransferase
MHVFYIEEIASEIVQLSDEESYHLSKVLRLKLGSNVYLTNGKGIFCEASVIDNHQKYSKLKITNTKTDYGKLNYNLSIAIAPTKNIDRFEWFLEKATEIGIDTIYPMVCEKSERDVIKNERLEKIIMAAMKQSVAAYKPVLKEIKPFKEIIKNNTAQKFIAHCHGTTKQDIIKICKPTESTIILIGPEGDFSKLEIESALQNGFLPVTLGNKRLRTETAGIIACNMVSIINN